ncbi:ATP-dependent helicase C-terminal domain-containing protein, partial [Pseudomonas aeruginosa]
DLSDANLLETLEDWLTPYLGKVTRLSHFSQLDLSSIVRNLLPWPLPQELETQAPQAIQVPSGSNIRIDYSQHPPILAVRL